MSPQLNQILQQAETLPADDQLELISHLVQKMRLTARVQSPEVGQTGLQSAKNGKSILQIAAEFAGDLPDTELAKLPSDGAQQHDHYIYGTPKLGA
jgi:hypothetical protein